MGRPELRRRPPELGGNINAHWSFKNNWSHRASASTRAPGSFDDRATRGGPGANFDSSWSFWSYVNTDDRKPVAFDTFLGGGNSEFGPHFFDANPALTFRPMPVAVDQRRLPLQPFRTTTRSG